MKPVCRFFAHNAMGCMLLLAGAWSPCMASPGVSPAPSAPLQPFLAGIKGQARARLAEPVTPSTLRFSAELTEPLVRHKPPRHILLPRGTRLLCTVRHYARAKGRLLATCGHAVRPAEPGRMQEMIPLSGAFLSQDPGMVGLAAAAPGQKQFIMPAHTPVWLVLAPSRASAF